jgi:hypothetical protein
MRAIPVSELDRFLAIPKDRFGRRQIKKANMPTPINVTNDDSVLPLDLSAKPC